ncbi:MAG: aminotransferase class IV [Deltaproteobacteria bacterium]|nr:aminotransferase class IV [Deltaproteobacteria bacterium]
MLVNDRLQPAARAAISALDRGFLYGDGLFETVRTYRGRPFGLEQHLARLARSARAFRIPFERDPAYWRPRVARLLRANALDASDAAVRLTISRGAGPLGLLPPPGLRPTTLLVASAIDTRLRGAQARGVGVCFFPYRLVTATLPSHKTLHYLPAVLGKMLAARARAFEALYLSADDSVLEGTTSNVFVVREGTLITPPLHGILPGVTRRFLAAVARRARIPLREAAIARRELLAADEVFLTASTIEVLPVIRVERHAIGRGVPGAVTRRLQEEYTRFVTATLARPLRSRAPSRSASGASRRR